MGVGGGHDRHWCGRFYPSKLPASAMLRYYLERFDTVELNNSFYRLPSEDAFQAWREAVPQNFIFAVKASRFLTHRIKLNNPQQALDNLLPRAELLQEKLGPILFQLPPRWRGNLERPEKFFETVRRQH